MLYKNLSGYLREKYGKRLKKICIDGHFTCPNRDGKCSTGGCIFCGERGAGEHIEENLSIKLQVENALLSSSPDEEFIAYFQNFTNTYAPLAELKKRYDAALISDRIRVLSIGTRPDCIDEEIAALIASYKDTREVWVELGLQTANDETARLINRGYLKEEFERAVKILNRHGIKIVVHLIIGLPGEDESDVKATTEYLRAFDIFGIKIHSLYVMAGTKLEKMYNAGLYTPISLDEYARLAAYVIKNSNESIIFHRITGDCPEGLLVAPAWNGTKFEIINKIEENLKI